MKNKMTNKEKYLILFESIALIATYKKRCHIADKESDERILGLTKMMAEVSDNMTDSEMDNILKELKNDCDTTYDGWKNLLGEY
jgi:hypothetical protein